MEGNLRSNVDKAPFQGKYFFSGDYKNLSSAIVRKFGHVNQYTGHLAQATTNAEMLQLRGLGMGCLRQNFPLCSLCNIFTANCRGEGGKKANISGQLSRQKMG